MAFSLPVRPATVAPSSESPPNPPLNVSASRFAQAPIAQAHPFFGLPKDVGAETLSYLPWNQISASRGCCQQFHGLVVTYERHYVEPRIAFHEGRLKRIVADLNYAQMPTDADTIFASLQLWTPKRGSFSDDVTSLISLSKWFSHLSGGQVHNYWDLHNRMPFETWAHVASLALHFRFRGKDLGLVTVGRPESQRKPWRTFRRYLQAIPNLPLSETEQKKLFNRIMSVRNSRDREAKSWARIGTPKYPQATFDDPPIPGEILGHFIWLPDLAYTDTFCYYVKKPWVADLLKDLYRRFPDGQEEMCPLMKASVLELVDIF